MINGVFSLFNYTLFPLSFKWLIHVKPVIIVVSNQHDTIVTFSRIGVFIFSRFVSRIWLRQEVSRNLQNSAYTVHALCGYINLSEVGTIFTAFKIVR
jgi:hypothetical protein